MTVPVKDNGNTNGHVVSALIPALGFPLGIKTTGDSAYSNGLARLNDLTKEGMLQAIKDEDLRFLSVVSGSLTVYRSQLIRYFLLAGGQ